jgi:arylformamidase
MLQSDWVDLTKTVSEMMKVYPGDPFVEMETLRTVSEDGFAIKCLTTCMHAGTHLDAPSHFLTTGGDVTTIPLEKTIGWANKITVLPEQGILKTATIRQAYAKLSKKHPRILLDTGWEKQSQTTDFFTGYYGFEPDLIDFIQENGIRLWGSDLPSVKFGPDDTQGAHVALLSHGVVIVEGLIHLEELDSSVWFVALPLKLAGMDGSLVRAIASRSKNALK